MNEENNIISVNKEVDVIEYDINNIKNLIYTIRGQQVMLDSDVAMLYHYETKYINLAVKRNKERFPENFCFQLTDIETENLRLQFATSSLTKENHGGRRTLPYVFTEQGIAMLSGLLKNHIAVQVSINIMNAFVEMRKFLVANGPVFERLSNVEYKLLDQDRKLSNHEKNFEKIFDELQKNKKEQFSQKIFFDGQIYEAYSLIIDIIKTAKNKILIIDNYIDDSILKMISKKNKDVEVVILTSQNYNLSKLDINKFNKQYPTLKVAITNKFHDRFIVIDNKELYHCGASLKDLGKKCFAINKMEDVNFLKNIEKCIELC
ncbi:MAG: ORF6N domain-containing protein [Clostridia bacterium]|nr:ORF6N domain-containing protein [Clostridia bacterium]